MHMHRLLHMQCLKLASPELSRHFSQQALSRVTATEPAMNECRNNGEMIIRRSLPRLRRALRLVRRGALPELAWKLSSIYWDHQSCW